MLYLYSGNREQFLVLSTIGKILIQMEVSDKGSVRAILLKYEVNTAARNDWKITI